MLLQERAGKSSLHVTITCTGISFLVCMNSRSPLCIIMPVNASKFVTAIYRSRPTSQKFVCSHRSTAIRCRIQGGRVHTRLRPITAGLEVAMSTSMLESCAACASPTLHGSGDSTVNQVGIAVTTCTTVRSVELLWFTIHVSVS